MLLFEFLMKKTIMEKEKQLIKSKNPLKKHFGSFKFKRTTEKILKEGDKESWDE